MHSDVGANRARFSAVKKSRKLDGIKCCPREPAPAAAGAPGMLTTVAGRLTGSANIFDADWDAGLPGNLAAGARLPGQRAGTHLAAACLHTGVLPATAPSIPTRACGYPDPVSLRTQTHTPFFLPA
jgi:hypothetical protein